jgi:putative ATP-dependent endonuclease of OLD family
VEIEVRFCDVKDDIRKELETKRLLSKSGDLVIRKSCMVGQKKPDVRIVVYDFTDERFQNLRSKKEKDLNSLGDECGLGFTKSGRSITNESKIQKLLEYAEKQGIPKDNVIIAVDTDTWQEIENILPDFALFPSYMTLGTDQAQFQNPFCEMIMNQIQIDKPLTDGIQEKVGKAISEAIKEIETNLLQQTDTVTRLLPKPEYQWKKLVNLNIETEDQFGTVVPLAYRGLGVQRLAMVAFLKYVAEHDTKKRQCMIFGIEEPETFLHPSAQRDLINAFWQLKNKGCQIIITSHSPVFAAEADEDDLILVTRRGAGASITQGSELSTDMIVEELGILPRDQLVGLNACVFVEGPADQTYLETVAKTLKASGKLSSEFAERKIGVVLVAGDNLRFYVEKGLLKKLNRNFAVLVDSDKKNPGDSISQKLLRWKTKCESDGGTFKILRKRSVENYLHPEAMKRVLSRDITINDFNDVKSQIPNYDWRKHLKPVVEAMTTDEILNMDKYTDETGNERHEILEVLEELLKIAE